MRAGALPRAVLLDTCAVIWLANGDALANSASAAIVHAGLADGVYVSPVSAWEVGLLSKPKAGHIKGVRFIPDTEDLVRAGDGWTRDQGGVADARDASYLPGELHGDPGDRLIVTTARHLGVPIVTRDRRIIDYGRGGHVQVIAC